MRMLTTKAIALLITFSVAAFAQQKGTFTDSRDKKTYKTVKIGTQTWMAENLNYEASGSKCYDNNTVSCTRYGRLYDWVTALALPVSCKSSECASQVSAIHKGICPSGWHIPSDAEWNALMKFVNTSCSDNSSCVNAGTKLKATSGWNNSGSKSGNGTDDFGFSALPGGYGNPNGSFESVGNHSGLWSTSENGSNGANTRYLYHSRESADYYPYGGKSMLFSVRCVQDGTAAEAIVKAAAAAAEAKAKAEAEAEAKINAAAATARAALKTNSGTFTDPRDKKKYKTIKIGEQVWMAENLNYADKNRKCYDNKPENCTKYGSLYNWETALKACPKGWYLPYNEDWNALMKFINPSCSDNSSCDKAGTKLKAESGWNDYEGKSGNGTNDYGFSALPSGNGNFGMWWSSSDKNDGSNYAYSRDMTNYKDEYARYSNSDKGNFLSVRCLQGDAKEIAAKVAAKVKAEADAAEKAMVEAREAALKANSGSFTDTRDKKNYKTIKIGTQTWLAENLNYDTKGGKCYDNRPANCDKYGRLYNWETAKSACPKDWHLPNNEEWEVLKTTAGDDAGKNLKAISGWNSGGNGYDKFGFSALPGGYTGYDGNSFFDIGSFGGWWSTSEGYVGDAYFWHMSGNFLGNGSGKNGNKNFFRSVRCVKDDAEAIAKAKVEAEAKAKAAAEARAAVLKTNGGSFTDTRDKKNYKTIKIGTQTWLAENLNYDTKGGKCYDNKPENCTKYGRLYDWPTALALPDKCNSSECVSQVSAKHKGICPSGWHIPSNADWNVLMKFVNPGCSDDIHCGNAGTKLKAVSGWDLISGNLSTVGTDDYGFSALPGGSHNPEGYFIGVGRSGSWWSSTENFSEYAYRKDMDFNDNSVVHSQNRFKSHLFSVRCIKD